MTASASWSVSMWWVVNTWLGVVARDSNSP